MAGTLTITGESGAVDWASRIALATEYARNEGVSTYFPGGSYRVGSSISMYRCVLDKATFTPTAAATNDIRLLFTELDNRDGTFSIDTDGNGHLCFPKLADGELRASWLGYPLQTYYGSGYSVDGPETVFIDTDSSSTDTLALENVRVVAASGISYGLSLTGCEVEFVGSPTLSYTAGTLNASHTFTDCTITGTCTAAGNVTLTSCNSLPLTFFTTDTDYIGRMVGASTDMTFYVPETIELSGLSVSSTTAAFNFAYGAVLSCDTELTLKNPAAYKHAFKNLGANIKIPEGETAHANWFDTLQHWLECGSCFYDGDGATIDDDGLTAFLALTDARVSNLYLTSTYMSSIPEGVHCDGCSFADMTESLEIGYKADVKQNMGVAYVATDDETVAADMDHTVISPGGIVTTGTVSGAYGKFPSKQILKYSDCCSDYYDSDVFADYWCAVVPLTEYFSSIVSESEWEGTVFMFIDDYDFTGTYKLVRYYCPPQLSFVGFGGTTYYLPMPRETDNSGPCRAAYAQMFIGTIEEVDGTDTRCLYLLGGDAESSDRRLYDTLQTMSKTEAE